MKKTILCMCSLSVAACLAGGCDFFRTLAGRPTSADIEMKRAEIEAEEVAGQARLDSIKKEVERQISDSLALEEITKSRDEVLISPTRLGGLAVSNLPHKYYIIIGSFMDSRNAERKAERVRKAGHEVTLITFRNGYTAVGVCGNSSLSKVYASLDLIKGQDFCPKDAWILVNN